MQLDVQIAVRISKERLAALDALRKLEDDLPTRAEMLRRLIERAKR